jgi:hypothetical protein
MIWLKRLLVMGAMSGAFVVIFLAGCSKNLGHISPNQAPQTYLSFAPDEGGITNYRVRLNWFGWDPDGEIAYYRTKWDTLDWVRVVNTDSVFILSASADSVDPQKGYEAHTFKVSAVDNEGLVDATPETVTFTAFTFVPETQILRGPNGVTGPMVTFEWQGRDRDGVITGYEYKLYRRDEATGSWFEVTASGPLGADVTSVTFGPLAGQHKFEVWSIDDAGAPDLTPATRVFTCNPELAGPKLYVGTNVFGSFTFRGPVWKAQYNLPIPIFAGERLRFGWLADASDYGGQVVGYRHAYDDTSTWPAWSIFDTRFQVVPELGRHSLYIGAIDNANVKTRARVYFDVVEATLDQYILVVDDYNWRENLAAWGTDDARTAFYDSLLAGYAKTRVEWEPSQHVVGGTPQAPNVDALRGASTVVWYCDDELTTLKRLFDPRQTAYNSLAGYLRVGGNLVLDGYKIIGQIMDAQYPIQVSAADTSLSGVFVRDYLHVGYADNSANLSNKASPWAYGYCFYGAIPIDETMFEPIYIDSVGPGGYPELGKWPVYATQWTGSNIGLRHGGLPNVEKLQAYQGTALETFTIDSFLNQNFEGQVCGLLYLSGENHGNVSYLGFPLYYCRKPGVQAYMDEVLYLFGEERIRGRR